jgi:F0F1-type ATP synthase assembly protein I
MVGAVLVGTLGGWWLDGKLGISPWLTIGGSVLGIAGGMTVFLRAALATTRKKGAAGRQEKK